MTSGTNADDAMVYTIAANQVNVIRYLKAQRTLVIGTTAACLLYTSPSPRDS